MYGNWLKIWGMRVLSCYEVQPRRRLSGTSLPARKAFRLCILERDRSALLDAGKWPAHVTVSEWYFKGNAGVEVSDDRRAVAAAAAATASVASAARLEASDNQTVSDADPAAADDNVQAADGLSVSDLPAVSNAALTSVNREPLSAGNCIEIKVANEMECNDDTLISMVDKSAIITTSVDGSGC